MAFSRTTYRKGYYFALMGTGVACLIAVAIYSHRSPVLISAVVLLLFLPGRVLGYFWRDLLRGLRLLREKQYEESIKHSHAFLDTLQRRPWIRHLIWLGSGTYSRSPESFAFNNIGAAELSLGRYQLARTHLHESILHDSLNPLPFYNLSILATKEGNTEEASLMAASAAARGLTHGISDQIVMSSQKRFAQKNG